MLQRTMLFVPCAWHAGNTEKAQVALEMECVTMIRLACRWLLSHGCATLEGNRPGGAAHGNLLQQSASPPRIRAGRILVPTPPQLSQLSMRT